MQPITLDTVFLKLKQLPVDDQNKFVALFSNLDSTTIPQLSLYIDRIALALEEWEEDAIWVTKFKSPQMKLMALASETDSTLQTD